MWKRIQRFNALERRDQELFLGAYCLLPLISFSLRWRGFGKTKAFLEQFLSVMHGSQNPDAQKRAVRTTQMVQAAGQHGIGHPSCLEISLVLWWLLARQGIASDLRVGIRKSGGTFEAHAWVECGGAIMNETETHHRFAAFDTALASLPPEPR
jgi:hypothetical protein